MPDVNKTELLRIRVSKTEATSFAAAAKRDGVRLSEWARRAMAAAAKVRS